MWMWICCCCYLAACVEMHNSLGLLPPSFLDSPASFSYSPPCLYQFGSQNLQLSWGIILCSVVSSIDCGLRQPQRGEFLFPVRYHVVYCGSFPAWRFCSYVSPIVLPPLLPLLLLWPRFASFPFTGSCGNIIITCGRPNYTKNTTSRKGYSRANRTVRDLVLILLKIEDLGHIKNGLSWFTVKKV